MKDYAKKEKPAKKQRRSILLPTIGILLIFACTSIFYHAKTKNHGVIQDKKPTQQPEQPIKNVAAKKVSSKPITFDFYKLLPQMAVKTGDETPSPASPSLLKSSYFVLQIAALQNASDAKRLKSQLSHFGYTTFVQSYQSKNHQRWYRVMVGPFKTLKIAQSQQSKLYKNQIEALLLKVQPNENQPLA